MFGRTLLITFTAAALMGGCKKEDKDGGAGGQASPEAKEGKESKAAPKEGAAPATGAAQATSDPPAKTAQGEAAPATAEVGKPAPDFTLPDLDGKEVSLASFKGKTVVLEWFNPGCPYVKKSHTVGSLVDTAKKHGDAGVVWLAINSGAEGKQGFDPEENRKAAESWKMSHPILRDVDGKVGKAYGATNTPNMYVIGPDGTLVYAGAIDNSPDGEKGSPEGGTLVNHVEAALQDLAANRPVANPKTKPYGCGVKYAS